MASELQNESALITAAHPLRMLPALRTVRAARARSRPNLNRTGHPHDPVDHHRRQMRQQHLTPLELTCRTSSRLNDSPQRQHAQHQHHQICARALFHGHGQDPRPLAVDRDLRRCGDCGYGRLQRDLPRLLVLTARTITAILAPAMIENASATTKSPTCWYTVSTDPSGTLTTTTPR